MQPVTAKSYQLLEAGVTRGATLDGTAAICGAAGWSRENQKESSGMIQMDSIELIGTPPPWSVTSVDRFVASVLERAEREGGELPVHFHLTMCPWGERNAAARQGGEWSDVMDPRYRLVHFTGCGRPYLVAILTGDDAARRQRQAMRYLPWSEHYTASREGESLRLRFVAEVEQPEVDVRDAFEGRGRTLIELFESGEIHSW